MPAQDEWRRFVAMLTDEEIMQLRAALLETMNERVVIRDVWRKEEEGDPSKE